MEIYLATIFKEGSGNLPLLFFFICVAVFITLLVRATYDRMFAYPTGRHIMMAAYGEEPSRILLYVGNQKQFIHMRKINRQNTIPDKAVWTSGIITHNGVIIATPFTLPPHYVFDRVVERVREARIIRPNERIESFGTLLNDGTFVPFGK